jgi:protein TonB
MKKIISIVVFLFAGIILSAQTDSTKTVDKDSTVISFAETMPEFGGRIDGFQIYVHKNLKYPATDLEGTVYVEFVVEKDGSVSGAYVRKSSGVKELDAEALRLVSVMPAEWTPGTMNGRNVRVDVIEPIKFVLQ